MALWLNSLSQRNITRSVELLAGKFRISQSNSRGEAEKYLFLLITIQVLLKAGEGLSGQQNSQSFNIYLLVFVEGRLF